MKAEQQLLGVQFISFVMGAITLRLLQLIPGKGFLWFMLDCGGGCFGFFLTILLVEFFLFHSLQK